MYLGTITTLGVSLLMFDGKIWVPSSEDWQNLGALLQGWAEYGYPLPPTLIDLITRLLYMMYDLISAILVCGKIYVPPPPKISLLCHNILYVG